MRNPSLNPFGLVMLTVGVLIGLMSSRYFTPKRMASAPGQEPARPPISQHAIEPATHSGRVAHSGMDTPVESSASMSLRLSAEEVAEQRRLTERDEEGYSVLTSDYPLSRRMIRHSIAQSAERYLAQESQRYETLFGQVGLGGDTNKVDMLKQQISTIYEASQLASQSMLELASARQRFDATIRASMTTEQYQSFRHLEASAKSDPYMADIQRFAEAQDLSRISDSVRSTLVRSLQAHEPYLEESSIGPYDPSPAPQMGEGAVARHLNEHLNRVAVRVSNVLRELENSGASRDEVSTVRRYFAVKLDNLRRR